jgi:hypothetical protein
MAVHAKSGHLWRAVAGVLFVATVGSCDPPAAGPVVWRAAAISSSGLRYDVATERAKLGLAHDSTGNAFSEQ